MKRVQINTLLLCCAATLLGAGILGAQPKLPQKEIPILAWYGIPADEAKVERFQELKDAGFTLNFRGYSNADEVVKALDAAQKVGVKIIAACPELRNDTEATVKRFMKKSGDWMLWAIMLPLPYILTVCVRKLKRIRQSPDILKPCGEPDIGLKG